MHCAILVSGDVKYTRKLLDSAFFREIEGFSIAGMVASAPDAQALTRARTLHVPTFVVEEKLFPNVSSYGVALLNKLKDIDSDFVVADAMAAVPACVVKHFGGRLLRIRLTPVGQTMEITAYLSDAAGGVGEIMGEAVAALEADDTQERFTRRVYDLAEGLIVDAVESCCGM